MSLFAQGYARAFLEAAPSGYDVEPFLERAEAVRRALAGDARLKAFFAAPAVPEKAKKNALEELAACVDLDPYGRRFLGLLLKNRRLLDLPAIVGALRDEADRARDVVEAQVTLASPAGEAEGRQIADALARAVGRRVRLKTRVDPAILGGFVARVGSEVFDASIRHAIERFKEKAMEETRV